MGNRKHILTAVFLLIGLFPLPSRADTATDIPGDPVTFFAQCAGRLSAELSHQWMRAEPNADSTEALHRATLSILAAMIGPEQSREILNLRIETRRAHAALLSRGLRHGDAWALARAERAIAACTAFVLGPSAPDRNVTPPATALPEDVNPAALSTD